MDEVKEKNIECCNALISIAYADGNFLRSAWLLVIDQISELAKMRDDFKFGYDVAKSEGVFEYSARLDRESIVDFVKAVCDKSQAELKEEPPRSFLVEKLSIVTQVNVKREHFIWIQMWAYLGEYIRNVGSFYNATISNLAVDILRRLSRNLLQQAELTQFHFQEKFMQPFSDIFKNHKDAKVKEMVLISIKEIIHELANNLQSGWSVIFSILDLSAKFPETENGGFSVTESLVNDHLDVVAGLFSRVVSVFSSFIENAKDEIKVKAIPYLTKVANSTQDSDLPVWRSIFESFQLASHCKNEHVRKIAHEQVLATFDLVLSRNLEDSLVKDILVEHLPGSIKDENNTTKTFYAQVALLLKTLCDGLINRYYDERLCNFWPEILKLISVAILGPSRQLAAFGLGLLKDFVEKHGSSFDGEKIKCLVDECHTILVTGLLAMNLENQKTFASLLLTFVNTFKNDDFITLLYETDAVCEQAEQHRNILNFWCVVRSTLLKALLVLKDQNEQKIIDCVFRTLELYHQFEFPSQSETTAGTAWNAHIVMSLETVSAFPDDLFEKTFDKSSQLIVKTVAAKSLDVRKHITQLLKRKLVK